MNWREPIGWPSVESIARVWLEHEALLYLGNPGAVEVGPVNLLCADEVLALFRTAPADVWRTADAT